MASCSPSRVWGDHETIWAKEKMGPAPILAYREMLEDTFGPYLTDCRFHAHLSIFKNVEATPQKKARFKASNMYVTLSPINLELVTLRERKVPGEVLRQPLTVVPLGQDVPPHSRCIKRNKESSLMSHVTCEAMTMVPDVSMIS